MTVVPEPGVLSIRSVPPIAHPKFSDALTRDESQHDRPARHSSNFLAGIKRRRSVQFLRNTRAGAERALFTHRRKQAYLALHPETGHGGDREASRQVGDLIRERENVVRFTKDTAARTGRSERDVQRDADRGGKIEETN
jgi:hypothetical protein